MKKGYVITGDGDNSYEIPYNLYEDFQIDVNKRPNDYSSDEFYDYCDDFNKKWGEYQI